MRKVKRWLSLMAIGLCVTLLGCSQDASRQDSLPKLRKRLAVDEVNAQSPLMITSPDMDQNGLIPEAFTFYGQNRKPRFDVVGQPESTVTFAMIMEDFDAPGDSPFVHWVVYNIPVKEINGAILPTPNSVVGKNSTDNLDYYGPHPPPRDKPHHYHFQFFAVKKRLLLEPGATRDQVVDALQTSVVAKGEFEVTYQSP
jgi:Raf kinase inhibitor-like YbhB/YbcL family protein